MLAGQDGSATALHTMTNVEASPVVYRMDPREQLDFYNRLDQDGLEEVGAYHSHTHSPAFPSPTDVERAFYPQAAYVLVSLLDRSRPDLRAFRIIDGKITEIEVVRDGEAH
jgi:proteasome lid subunit RPN8/RPN11